MRDMMKFAKDNNIDETNRIPMMGEKKHHSNLKNLVDEAYFWMKSINNNDYKDCNDNQSILNH